MILAHLSLDNKICHASSKIAQIPMLKIIFFALYVLFMASFKNRKTNTCRGWEKNFQLSTQHMEKVGKSSFEAKF